RHPGRHGAGERLGRAHPEMGLHVRLRPLEPDPGAVAGRHGAGPDRLLLATRPVRTDAPGDAVAVAGRRGAAVLAARPAVRPGAGHRSHDHAARPRLDHPRQPVRRGGDGRADVRLPGPVPRAGAAAARRTGAGGAHDPDPVRRPVAGVRAAVLRLRAGPVREHDPAGGGGLGPCRVRAAAGAGPPVVPPFPVRPAGVGLARGHVPFAARPVPAHGGRGGLSHLTRRALRAAARCGYLSFMGGAGRPSHSSSNNGRRHNPVEAFLAWINGIIWSNALLALCLGAGLRFTFRTRGMQVRGFAELCRLTVPGQKSDAGVSSFQALAASTAGPTGIAIIAGVATAIAYGGPGAVFWMWVMGFLGASTSYVESTLAQIYKEKDAEGRYRGGPAYYIEKAMGLKWYAVLFAVATVVATGLLLPGVQANAIADSASSVLCNGTADTCAALGGSGMLKLWIGLAVAFLLGLIIFGGIKRIATFAEVVVPFMALAFILMAVIVMIVNADKVPAMFADIFSSAFGGHAAFGAILGQAIAWGVKRGVYANEAGQGTGPHAAAAAEVSHPAKQGYVQAFAIYFDTMLVCTSTAFLLLSTGMYNTFRVVVEDGKETLQAIVTGVPGVQPSEGAQFTQAAVESVLPGWGAGFVALALFFFAFTTIMAYYYMAETNLTYLAGVRKTHPLATLLLRLGIIGMV